MRWWAISPGPSATPRGAPRVAPRTITEHTAGPCDLESRCPVRTNWGLINRTVMHALERLSLTDMAVPRSTGDSRSRLNIVETP